MTGTTIIFKSLMKRSPKNLEPSTKGLTESGKNPRIMPDNRAEYQANEDAGEKIGFKIPIKNPPLFFLVRH